MPIRHLFVSMFGVVSQMACSHEPGSSPPARPEPPALAAPAPIDDDGSGRVVRGSAPSSDPATDHAILAREAPTSGGSPGRGTANGLGGARAGAGGVGIGGAAGAKPVVGTQSL